MKGRFLILIFLFLISLQTVCAESHTGEVDMQLSEDAPDWSLLNASVYGTEGEIKIEGGLHYAGVASAGTPNTFVFRDARIDKEAAYSWTSIPQNVGGSFALYNSGVFAGSGGITIHRVNDVDIGRVDIWYQFDDTDFVPSDSEIYYDVTLYASPISEYYNQFVLEKTANSYSTQNAAFILVSGPYGGVHASWATGANSYVEYDYYGHFINEYNITLSGAIASTVITRDGLGQQLSSSKFKLKNSTGSTVYMPSSYSTTNSTHNHDNGSYYYYLDVENYGDVLIYEGMGSAPPHTGDIEFNQTFYTDPEDIQVSWDVDSFDSDAYTYEIQVITSVSGNPSQDSWPADGNWNVSPFISSASGAAVFDFYSAGYDLPIWIQGELWAQDKSSGTWVKLDNTPAVIYHEAALEAGKVWTDKESYNVTEIVTIYTDTVDGGYLMVDKRNDPLYDSYNIYSGLSHVKFSLQTSHVGTWDVYLYENSVITNSTVFTVLADNDTAYFSWWGDVQKGEAAFYDYVATSSNSVITIYDGVGEKQYSFNATPGYNEGQISTMPGEAGNWTGSLYDGGVYCNSSLEVYASESWIRFVDDSYYLGDTIEIEYFIIDSDHIIRLRDGLCQYGGRSTILTWMPGSFHTGQRGTLEFTLSDDNEFGLQVETNLESGYYLPGEWEVQASGMTESGYRSTDDTTYVHGTAKEDSDDPAEVSNEMIGIFFSPQGIFLMFTVIITVMGLAVTKQPAGGAVCAVLGVGFGRFFNVLPTWMLLLTVIALVAFAGVSTAIYIKGK